MNMQAPIDAVVEVTKLNKNVPSPDGELQILQDISFVVHKGETVAIVGTSGAGKSTLLGLLAGLDEPSSGSVRIQGQELFDLDEDGRARLRGECMGFVFQMFQLLPGLTALENVMLPLELVGRGNSQTAARDVLHRVGLGARLQHYPKQLSGGEQQRVALARAFAPRPAILLADEPTGNLDARTGAQVIDLIFELNRELGTTLLLVTHDQHLAQRCKRVLRLEAGRCVSEVAQ
ncbi:MAG: ABC transporter ATP-binding protein [Pseudomonadota bacterium]